MIKRIIDISEPSYVHLKNKQLLIDQEGQTVGQIAIEDLGIVILQSLRIVVTQQVIIACQQNNVAIVFCDEKHLPYSAIYPIAESNNLHSKILKQQLRVSEPIKKNLWKQIVTQKIKNQAGTLSTLNIDNKRLSQLAKKVKSGDSDNAEAVAAQAYWKLLFGKSFKRSVETNGINHLLNYGYSIVRATIARAICGAGLHPSIGLFHCNQYNALCLADDLMEPFRPWVDLCVFHLSENTQEVEINQDTKQALLSLISKPVKYDGKTMPFMVSCHYLMANLKRCYTKETKRLKFPLMEK